MKDEQTQVHEFMVKAQQATPAAPVMPPVDVRILRVKLIAEELLELAAAYGLSLRIYEDDEGAPHTEINDVCQNQKLNEQESLDCLVEAYDAVLDLMVVVIGTGVAMGTDLQPGWDEVHASNLTKFIDGHRRYDGKWVKGPSYRPANLRPIIEAQLAQAANQPELPPP